MRRARAQSAYDGSVKRLVSALTAVVAAILLPIEITGGQAAETAGWAMKVSGRKRVPAGEGQEPAASPTA